MTDTDRVAAQIAQNYPIEVARIRYLLHLADGDEALVRKALDYGAPLGAGRYSLTHGRQPDMADVAANVLRLIKQPPMVSATRVTDSLMRAAQSKE